jgi:hypothetical protein
MTFVWSKNGACFERGTSKLSGHSILGRVHIPYCGANLAMGKDPGSGILPSLKG